MNTTARITAPLVLSVASTTAFSATHCTADESVIFSCPLARSGKVVSLCAGGSGSGDISWAQYRFGRIGRPEMVYPASRAGSLEKFAGLHQTSRAIGLEIREVWFRVGVHSYLIEHASGGDRDPASPAEDNDLVVFRHGRQVVARHSCTPPVVNRLFELDGHISDDQTGRPG